LRQVSIAVSLESIDVAADQRKESGGVRVRHRRGRGRGLHPDWATVLTCALDLPLILVPLAVLFNNQGFVKNESRAVSP
jgi:hypothetical protein